MIYAKAIAAGVVTSLVTSAIVVAVAMWPVLASAQRVGGVQNVYLVIHPMSIFIVVAGFSIGFGWTLWRVR